MRYQSTLIAVTDMARSLAFYQDVLGQEVLLDYGGNVTLSCGIALQSMEGWKQFLGTEDIKLKGRDGELYFEEDDMDSFLKSLENKEIEFVHPLETQPWGQRCIRFYDPDGHIIEVGENMAAVTKRFRDNGLTVEEIAKQMGIAEEYVRAYLEQ